MSRNRSRGISGQAVVSVVGAVALLGAGLAALFGAGSPARSVSLRDGAVWVQSLTGSLERLDTGSGVIGYRLTTPVARAPLQIVDDGTTAVLRDPVTGAIRSIDLSGAKAKLTAPADLAREAQLVSGSGRTYVLLAERGEVAVLDPATLAVGEAINLGGPLGSAAVDGAGTLWVTIASLGVVVPVSAKEGRAVRGEPAGVADPGTAIDVTVSAGAAYVIDRVKGTLLSLRPGRATAVAAVPGGALVAAAQGEPADGHVVLGDAGGVILRIDPGTGRTTRFALAGRANHRLGPPVQAHNRIAVPDLTTGELVVIDPVTGTSEAPPVRRGAGAIPVTAADGGVVANDPGSPSAVVVTPAGDAEVVDKSGDAPGDDEPDFAPAPAPVPAAVPLPRPGPTLGPAPAAAPLAPGPGGPPAPPPSTPAKPPTAPTAVGGLRAVGGDATIDLSWTPGQNGGSPLVAHRIECSGTGSAGRLDAPGAATTATVRGLMNGVEHRCTVVPRNAVGPGPEATAGPVRPTDNVPGAPTGVLVTSGDASLAVRWTAPGVGGAPVAQYEVTATPAAGLPVTKMVPAGTTAIPVGGLVNGTPYAVTVRALEAAGAAGPPAAAAPVTPAGVPGPPQAVVATALSRAVDVRWQPAAPNGSPITGYMVKVSPGGYVKELPATAVQLAVRGLVNGTDYTVTVAAKNLMGYGAPSAPKAARPGAPEIGPVTVTSAGGTLFDVAFSVDWKGETPGLCGAVVDGGGISNTHTFGCSGGRFDALLYDTAFSIKVFARFARFAGGEAQRAPVTARTPDAPTIYLTRSYNDSPRDWFYGRPDESFRFANVQDSGIWVYSVPRPGTVPLLRWTDGRPDVHWYGAEGQAAPPGYRVDTTLGHIFTTNGPNRSDIRRYTRNDFAGSRAGRDCFMPSSPAQYSDLGPGGWTDEGTIGFGVRP